MADNQKDTKPQARLTGLVGNFSVDVSMDKETEYFDLFIFSEKRAHSFSSFKYK